MAEAEQKKEAQKEAKVPVPRLLGDMGISRFRAVGFMKHASLDNTSKMTEKELQKKYDAYKKLKAFGG